MAAFIGGRISYQLQTANRNDDTPKQLTISYTANWVADLRSIP